MSSMSFSLFFESPGRLEEVKFDRLKLLEIAVGETPGGALPCKH